MLKEFEYHQLTYQQKNIWFLEKLNPGIGIGNIAGTLKINESLDYNILNEAVNLMILRNEGFRLRVFEKDSSIVQYLSEYTEYKTDYFDFSNKDIKELYAWDHKAASVPFELLDSNLFYFALIKINENSYGFFVRIHHLISDAWSLTMIGNEVMLYYRTIKDGRPRPEDMNPSYIDYIISEDKYLKSDKFSRDKLFWKEEFKSIPELTTLKNKTTSRIGLRSERKSFVIPDKLSKKIKIHCEMNKTSIFSIFFSSLCIYINRVKNITDQVIGTPVLNRSNFKEKNMIGMFISTVPIRLDVDGEIDFVEFSRRVDRKWYSVLRHRKYPYECIIGDVRENDKGLEKLYDIAISYQNAKFTNDTDKYEYEARWHANKFQVESLYLHISDREDTGKITLNYDYLIDAFYDKEIDFIHDHLIRLLWHALDNPQRNLEDLHMLSEIEMKKVIYDLNNTGADYPKDSSIDGIFEDQVMKNPEATALVFENEKITYRELNEKANNMAAYLRNKGIGPEKIVAMTVPRSMEMIIAIMGIVKSGGAYLPIDPDYPIARINYMLNDSGADCLIYTKKLIEGLDFDGETFDICQLSKNKSNSDFNVDNENNVKPENLLYIIYTSGSTGKPKGVMIEHRNVVRLLYNSRNLFDFNDKDIWTLFHSYCFDFSVWEMYGALLYGGTLVIVPKETAKDTGDFLKLLKKEKVTILNQTPAAFHNLINTEMKFDDKSLCLRKVIFGGEALKPLILKPFRNKYPDTKLINMYGITETTVHVTYIEIDDEMINKNMCNVGRPIPTTSTYILDKNLNPLPIGIPGELCVGGDGVGRGYLNNNALTREKFIPNPFKSGDIIYRSGDLARFFPEGDIEYLGRIDTQVKIRGHRIELGEIESQLLKYNGVKEAVVIAKDTTMGNKRLAAYYTGETALMNDELRSFLLKYLPEYMVPTCFIKLDRIPLNSNGKVDVKNLEIPDEAEYEKNEYVKPEDEFQKKVEKIWSEVLGIDDIGIYDDFFKLGGDSLSAVTIVSMLGDNVSFPDLYNNPTIKSFSEVILKKSSENSKNDLLIRLTKGTEKYSKNIVCFPYGGGNGTIYMDLAFAIDQLDCDYCVYSIDLPGRETGKNNELLPNKEIALKLVEEIMSTIEGDIILYGHCVGSALALETAKILKNNDVGVRDVYLGAAIPPRKIKIPGMKYDPWKWVTNRNIMMFLRKIGLPKYEMEKEQEELIIESFRHDVRNYYYFFRKQENPEKNIIDIPTHCIVGDQDPMTRNYTKRHKRWSEYSNFRDLHVIENASHYFVKTNPRELAVIITGCD